MASVLSPSSLLLRFPNPNPNPSRTVLPRIKPLSTSPSIRRLRPAAALRAPATASPPSPFILSDSTRTISTLASIALAISKLFLSSASSSLSNLRSISFPPASSLLFARVKGRPSGYLNTPLTVVAAGMTKWLDIYSGILMVRVLLSWFPNIPWERQPLCAIRDLCDPYLNLFRNIIPPVFDTLDVSPLLAFAVLGTLGSILNNTRGMVY